MIRRHFRRRMRPALALLLAQLASSTALRLPHAAIASSIAPRRATSPALCAAATAAVEAASGNAASCLAYFEAWNKRDMQAAIALFSEDCVYEDTVYPEVFNGRSELEFHLLRVADALPSSFVFVIDDVSSGAADARAIGVRWHVEQRIIGAPQDDGTARRGWRRVDLNPVGGAPFHGHTDAVVAAR